MKQLRHVERSENLITESQLIDYIQPIDELPEPSAEYENYKYLLTQLSEQYLPGKTYVCVNDEKTGWKWVPINFVTDTSALVPPAKIWANCKRDPATKFATVYLHWDDPDDSEDAVWSHSIIIRKKGSKPTSIYDGELIGSSSVRDQYAGKTGFIDSIDIDSTSGSDIVDDDGSPAAVDPNEVYWYNVYAITKNGVISAGEPCQAMLTWEKLAEITREGIADHAFDIGDVISVTHSQLGAIDFQVVAFDNADVNRGYDNKYGLTHSVTFMACDVLFRGSFDHMEREYGETTDRMWLGTKTYYSQTGEAIDTNNSIWAAGGPAAYKKYTGGPACEKNPCSTASTYGNNRWRDSNARHWLNDTTDDWKTSGVDKWDQYSDDIDNHGAMGVPYIPGVNKGAILFDNFFNGLDPELRATMAYVNVKTTEPKWVGSTDSDDVKIETTVDRVFLPSYVELFGTDALMPSDISPNEGKQFDIYRDNVVNTRMRCILASYNTTAISTKQRSVDDNLASWWTRSPVAMGQWDPGTNTQSEIAINCVEIVTCEERQYDNLIGLGEDGCTGRQPYMPANITGSENTDIPRDVRNDRFVPVGSTKVYWNNVSPGFVPCFVIA